MKYLIQNSSTAPIFFSMVKNKEGRPTPGATFIFEPDNQITEISDEIYGEMLKNAFYKQKFEQGVLIALNAGKNASAAVTSGIQAKELEYSKYIALMNKISSSGGISNAQLRPFLDGDGMPTLDLVRENLGKNLSTDRAEEFRSRYIIERSNGMHESTLIIPAGGTVHTSGPEVKIKESEKEEPEGESDKKEKALEDYTIEELKTYADEIGVKYDEEVAFNRLLARVQKKLRANQEEK